jgi:hypothetical protein
MYEGNYLTNTLSPYAPIHRTPVVTFTATPNVGPVGVPTDVLLSWTSDLGVSASIDQGVGAVGINGTSNRVGVLATTTWTLTITKLDGTTYQQQVTYTAS